MYHAADGWRAYSCQASIREDLTCIDLPCPRPSHDPLSLSRHSTSAALPHLQPPLAAMSTLQSDPYAVLGVPKDATINVIKVRYRKLILKVHPDRYEGSHKQTASEEFQRVQTAYEILVNGDRRERYDAQVELQLRREASEKVARRSSERPLGEGERIGRVPDQILDDQSSSHGTSSNDGTSLSAYAPSVEEVDEHERSVSNS